MKIQGLAVIAIIIILPMAIILNSYTDSQIKTINLQITYDTKLRNATYDALKAFQLNMSNSDTSNVVDSKMRDIKASINTFYNSLSSNFNMSGYGANVLQNYVPAIVYTLYDGYYIYSAYDNKLDEDDKNKINENAKYTDGKMIYGLKPYIYYSCRYKPQNKDSDFVITYSLDSYIKIQGKVNGVFVNKSGYLLTGVSKESYNNSIIKYKYDGVDIISEKDREGLKQFVYKPGDTTPLNPIQFGDLWNSPGSLDCYPYKKVNGRKYYKDDNGVFVSINNNIIYQTINSDEIIKNEDGINYYSEALDFSDWVYSNLGDLKTTDAVDQNGNSYQDAVLYPKEKNPPFQIERSIFEELKNRENGNKWLEDPNSEFNAHRIEVIKNSIESNLVAAISNYNNVSSSEVNFAMPKLQDYEWEELTQNISMITFLQGLSLGGKIYNGHSIVRNDLTEDYVSEDSIYIVNHDYKIYYRVTDKNLVENAILNDNIITGVLNIDFERRTSLATAEKNDGSGEKLTKNIYYYPRQEIGAYGSIIGFNNVENISIIEYLKKGRLGDYGADKINSFKILSQAYYTALGRERYEMYRIYRFN